MQYPSCTWSSSFHVLYLFYSLFASSPHSICLMPRFLHLLPHSLLRPHHSSSTVHSCGVWKWCLSYHDITDLTIQFPYLFWRKQSFSNGHHGWWVDSATDRAIWLHRLYPTQTSYPTNFDWSKNICPSSASLGICSLSLLSPFFWFLPLHMTRRYILTVIVPR